MSSSSRVARPLPLTPTHSPAGIRVQAGAKLQFAADKNVTVQSTKNVLIEGLLTMRPASPTVVQTLRFTGINEASEVGGGMTPLDSDVGLWVTGAGQLDVEGSPKLAWARATGDVVAGATSVTLDATPAGWRQGDEISIAPTKAPTEEEDELSSYQGFDDCLGRVRQHGLARQGHH